MAKSRVAPIKAKRTIPQLELEAALLLAELIDLILKSMGLVVSKIFYWTDSSIILHWINKIPNNIFVSNRIHKILNLSTPDQWWHVRTDSNPADCVSRGVQPGELVNHKLWWEGPPWLKSSHLPLGPIPGSPPMDLPNEEPIICHATTTDASIFRRYSSYTTLKRTTAWILRFTHNAQIKGASRTILEPPPPLTLSELKTAEHRLIKLAQESTFPVELKSIGLGAEIPKTSKIHNLSPRIDQEGLLRVGGRVKRAPIPFDRKHPILLSGNHPLTRLILLHCHQNLLHASRESMMCHLNRKFWIVGGRKAISTVIKSCVSCHRFQAEASQQIMGDLPRARVTPSFPFESTGVDFCGPFDLRVFKLRNSRGRKAETTTYKGYIALFACMATKALHLEFVTNLTSDAFLASFRRFISRRGKPARMFSDNGTNFTSAANDLNILQQMQLQERIKTSLQDPTLLSELTNMGIEWNFNPPGAPHHGGLWEAGIKSVKFHLRRVMGNAILDYEEFSTLLTQIEAILNSRPLTPLTADPDDLEALTPGHFLVGRSLTSIPEPDLTLVQTNKLIRWQLVQKMSQCFWKRWSLQYLDQLQHRRKWNTTMENLKVGQLVLLMEDNSPPLLWPLARITEIHPGSDGNVRVVTLKTRGIYQEKGGKTELTFSVLTRPITKLIPLPTPEEGNASAVLRGDSQLPHSD